GSFPSLSRACAMPNAECVRSPARRCAEATRAAVRGCPPVLADWARDAGGSRRSGEIPLRRSSCHAPLVVLLPHKPRSCPATERVSLVHPDLLEAIEVQAVDIESRDVALPCGRRRRVADEHVRRIIEHDLLDLLVEHLALLRVLLRVRGINQAVHLR